MAGPILLAAGGTGGHLFPAEALALALGARGWRVHLATDHRVGTYGSDFPAEAVHIVPSATLSGGAMARLAGGLRLARGLVSARGLMGRVKPAAAIGFGGYPTVPPMLGAWLAGVPTAIHEQNAVLGRANRLLAPRVKAIAVTSERVRLGTAERAKMVLTGNPVRQIVREAAATPYRPIETGGPIRLVVFGGSQGARAFSEIVPPAIERLAPDLRSRLTIVQQCRPEDIETVRATYHAHGVTAELAAFFRDMPARIADAHLVVSRSGASTVAELAVIGRPAIMVPLPHALDQDQKANAELLVEAGGGWMAAQAELTPDRLAGELDTLFRNPDRLAEAAAKAGTLGRADAAERLADLAEAVAAGVPADTIRGVPA